VIKGEEGGKGRERRGGREREGGKGREGRKFKCLDEQGEAVGDGNETRPIEDIAFHSNATIIVVSTWLEEKEEEREKRGGRSRKREEYTGSNRVDT